MCPCSVHHCILKGFIVIGLYCINKTFTVSETFNGNKESIGIMSGSAHEHKICNYCPDCRTYVDSSQMCYTVTSMYGIHNYDIII